MNKKALAQGVLNLIETLTRKSKTLSEARKMVLLERLTYLSGALAVTILKDLKTKGPKNV